MSLALLLRSNQLRPPTVRDFPLRPSQTSSAPSAVNSESPKLRPISPRSRCQFLPEKLHAPRHQRFTQAMQQQRAVEMILP